MIPDALIERAETLLEEYRRAGRRLATAESCTGGLLTACLTEVPGSSDVVERGFIAYSNEAKTEVLDVPRELIGQVGAVSAEVAEAMAAGAIAHSRADAAVAITGIAGPGGGSAEKPVGLVYLGAARRGGVPSHERHDFAGGRAAVRRASVAAALDLLTRILA